MAENMREFLFWMKRVSKFGGKRFLSTGDKINVEKIRFLTQYLNWQNVPYFLIIQFSILIP